MRRLLHLNDASVMGNLTVDGGKAYCLEDFHYYEARSIACIEIERYLVEGGEAPQLDSDWILEMMRSCAELDDEGSEDSQAEL